MSDQHHPRVVCYCGHPHVRTPHLDRLAREGAHFTRAHCTNPICTPSRMRMITGQCPHRIGVLNNGFPLDRTVQVLVLQGTREGIEDENEDDDEDHCGDRAGAQLDDGFVDCGRKSGRNQPLLGTARPRRPRASSSARATES